MWETTCVYIVNYRLKLCVFLLIIALLLYGIPHFWSKEQNTISARQGFLGQIRSTPSVGIDSPLCKDQAKISIYYQLTRPDTVGWQFIAHGEEAKNCTLPNGAVCELTSNEYDYETADVLLIRECGTDVTQPAYPGQIMLRYNRGPEHKECNKVLPLGDIRVSYTLANAIPYPYICWPDIKQPLIDILRQEPPVGRNGVAMFVSHCIKWRQDYMTQLMEYIDVDSYGKCLHNTDMKSSRNIGSDSFISIKLDIIKSKGYKFVLTFENSPSLREYISEKIWHAYLAQAIPIYYGDSYIYDQVPGANSFIDAKKYEPKQLAALIKKIDEDESLYQSFFKFDIDHTLKFQKNCPTELLGCTMCKESYQLKQQRCRGRYTLASAAINTSN
ncbi:glycoprotein 3-alpha-L-fucosyltransferase A-like [Dysidea avara]|uniref:glycoprotein 3-alpha-L-fucosyltransferase A-like n=1 Tax=Dysidea avara TaxID=196820 RepID=UPI003320C1E4